MILDVCGKLMECLVFDDEMATLSKLMTISCTCGGVSGIGRSRSQTHISQCNFMQPQCGILKCTPLVDVCDDRVLSPVLNPAMRG